MVAQMFSSVKKKTKQFKKQLIGAKSNEISHLLNLAKISTVFLLIKHWLILKRSVLFI
jgi:hypothetical protein